MNERPSKTWNTSQHTFQDSVDEARHHSERRAREASMNDRATDERVREWLHYPRENERDAFRDRQELAAEVLELRAKVAEFIDCENKGGYELVEEQLAVADSSVRATLSFCRDGPIDDPKFGTMFSKAEAFETLRRPEATCLTHPQPTPN